MTGPGIDPRHMITADAFSVSKTVLGLPLATGRRRLVAFAIDGALVGVLAGLGWRILGLFLAFFFFRLATKGSPKPDPASGVPSRAAVGIGRGFRYSVGCLGGVILFATFIFATGTLGNLLERVSGSGEGDLPGVVSNVLVAGRGGQALSTAGSEEEAEAAAVALGTAGLRLDPNLTLSEMMEVIADGTPELDMDRDAFLERVAAQIGERVPTAEQQESAEMSLDSALAVYRAGIGAPADGDPSDSTALAAPELAAQRFEEARSRIAAEVSRDELRSQERTIADLQSDLERQRQATIEAAAGGGILGWFVDTLDDLGLTFGWGALYFATLLAWFQGRTPGKRLLGMRVIRLDGEPITLFIAFERAGGYAAGVATGLLGFAQVLWDPNRQAIHDKIAGTVVIMDGQERLPGADVAVF